MQCSCLFNEVKHHKYINVWETLVIYISKYWKSVKNHITVIRKYIAATTAKEWILVSWTYLLIPKLYMIFVPFEKVPPQWKVLYHYSERSSTFRFDQVRCEYRCLFWIFWSHITLSSWITSCISDRSNSTTWFYHPDRLINNYTIKLSQKSWGNFDDQLTFKDHIAKLLDPAGLHCTT